MAKSYHHGNLREALFDAASSLLEDKGVQGLSLRGVARAAGVSQAAPYHHFKDKEALLVELSCSGFQHLSQVMGEAAFASENRRMRIEAIGRVYIRFARENPHLYRLMFGSAIEDKECYPELTGVTKDAFDMLLALIAEGIAEGDLRGKDPLPLALAAWSAVHGAAQLLLDGIHERGKMVDAGVTAELLIESTIDVLLNGMRKSPVRE